MSQIDYIYNKDVFEEDKSLEPNDYAIYPRFTLKELKIIFDALKVFPEENLLFEEWMELFDKLLYIQKKEIEWRT